MGPGGRVTFFPDAEQGIIPSSSDIGLDGLFSFVTESLGDLLEGSVACFQPLVNEVDKARSVTSLIRWEVSSMGSYVLGIRLSLTLHEDNV